MEVAGCRDLKQGKPLSTCEGRDSVLRSSLRQQVYLTHAVVYVAL